jgi:serine/threonine-protein kinase
MNLPELQSEQQIEAQVEQFLERLQAGETPDRTALAAAHPYLAPLLDRRLALVERMFHAAQAARSAAPQAGLPERAIHLKCPHCGNRIQLVEPQSAEITCHNCGSTFHVEPAATADYQPEPVPATIGKFQVLALLGRGAFGTVYKARDPELDRVVAVKVPRAGSVGMSEEEWRFFREAQCAAHLRHPGIVRMYEIGQDGDRKYIVSDYIDGLTLADLLTGNRPSFPDAARLVTEVAEALDYAHRQKVIHRDIKPSNILLDAAGRPHVADFGLARRVEGEITVTLDGQILGTPAYMAPEQAAGEARTVDGRTDVYSLGVVLYELLTGELPFRGNQRMLLHQVLHEEPQPPRRLNDRIPRDLETVCLKAMAKEPGRRYATAGALADDLRRFLTGAPIQARPVGPTERLWRWCRRNPLVASLAAALVAVLLAGLVGMTLLWLRADQRRRDAEAAQEQMRQQKQRANQNLARARAAVETYLRKTAKDPRLQAGDFVALRKELLATAIPFFEEFVMQAKDDPELEAERGRAYGELAFAHMEMGQTAEALADYQQSLAIYADLANQFPDDPSHRANMAVNQHQRGLAFSELGKHAEAEAAYREALRLREQLTAEFPDRPVYRYETAETYQHLGNRLAERGQAPEALTAYREARPLFEQLAQEFPAEPQYQDDLAIHLLMAGNLHRQLGKFADAEAAYRRVVEIREKLDEKYSNIPLYRHRLASAWMGLAVALRDTGKWPQAEKACGAALAVHEKLVAAFPGVPEYKLSLANCCTNLAGMRFELGRRPEAKAAYEKALAIHQELVKEFPLVGDYQVGLAGTYVNLAALVQDDQPAAAVEWCSKAIATVGPGLAQVPRLVKAHECLSKAHFLRAWNLTRLGRHAEALPDWDRALDKDMGPVPDQFRLQRALTLARLKEHKRAVAEAKAVTEAKDVPADLLHDAASVYAVSSAAVLGDPKLHEEYAARAVELLRWSIAMGLADVEQKLKNPDLDPVRARADFQKLPKTAIEQWTEVIRAHPQEATPYVSRGVHYSWKGELDKAIADYTQAIKLNPKLAVAYRNRGRDYGTRGEHDRAIADFTQSIKLEPDNASAYCDRGRDYFLKGNFDQAIVDATRALERDPNLALAYYNRGEALLKKQHYNQAIADFTKVIQLEPDNDYAIYQRGYAYSQKGAYDKSIIEFTEAIRLNPKVATFYLNRAMDYADKGEHAKAVADCTQAIKLEPSHAMAYNLRAAAYRALGDKTKAAADERKLEELKVKSRR